MTNYTEDRWIIREGDFTEAEFVITTEGREDNGVVPICEINCDFEGKVGIEQKANVKLLRAAPELLQALKLLTEAYCEVGYTMSREERFNGRKVLTSVLALIAEVEGETK